MFSRKELDAAHALVMAQMAPTPARNWPLLSEAVGTDLVVKHENFAPTGAFKVRGGITFMDWLCRAHPGTRGIVTATRGNHGQSQARAAAAAGLTAKIFVPHGNSTEKNAAMRAFGAEVVEFGADFDAARSEAMRVAEAENLYPVPSFHHDLVCGVATYGLELFSEHPDLDVVYVPIGLGSGICGTIAARDAMGARAEIVAVVAAEAPCARLSVEAGRLVESNAAATFADGLAVRVPSAEALAIYGPGAARFVTVSEGEIAAAMSLYFQGAHTVAEGAGAAALAAAMRERERIRGRKAAVILTGANIDLPKYAEVLSGGIPAP